MTRDGHGGLDYAALFAAVPAACVVLDRDLVIVEANDAYTAVTGRARADLLGHGLFDAFPPDPQDLSRQGVEVHRRSLSGVLATGRPGVLILHRYPLRHATDPGAFEQRWWNVVNQPLIGADGRVELIIHRVDDMTEFVLSQESDETTRPASADVPRTAVGSTKVQVPSAELFARARELQRANAQLEESAARTGEVALALQRAMLSTPDLSAHPEIAVRYRPALAGMNACGDWYDVVDLPDSRLALTVGDVVGHGVDAASVMGMLRSALSAAIRAADGPGRALETLGLYARAMDGALASTTFVCQLFPMSRLLTYSSAGHPPPVLVHADGTHEFLDQATDPPLGVRPEHVPQPQASVGYQEGDTLVLYTDGLIERHGEDIDVGLSRLVTAVRELRELSPAALTDRLLGVMADPAGQQDDISLLVAKL